MHEQLPFCVDHAGPVRVSRAVTLRKSTLTAVCRRDPDPRHDTLVPYLLKGVLDDNGLCFNFIQEAIKRFDDDDAIPALFNDAMVQISSKLGTLSMNDDYKPYVQVRLMNEMPSTTRP